MLLAEDIMTPDPLSVDEGALVREAFAILADGDIRHLPVTREGELIGMLSDRDLRAVGVSAVEDLESLDAMRSRLISPITDFMGGGVVSVETKSPLTELVDVLLEEKIGAVAIVEPGTMHLVGIVSYVDVLKTARELF